jgi:hypothetical protein
MNTKVRVFCILAVLAILLTAFAGSAQAAKPNFCEQHPEHRKCQDTGGSEEDSSDVVETDTTETQVASDGDQTVEGPGNTVIVCQAHNHNKFHDHPVSANNAAKYIKKHTGSYMGPCKNSGGGGDDQDDDDTIIIVDDDDEQKERERRVRNNDEEIVVLSGTYTTTLTAAPASGCYNESYINGNENVVVQICGDNNTVDISYGDSEQAASMLDVTNANINQARWDLDVLQGQIQLLNEQFYNNLTPVTQDPVDLTWLKTPLWVLVIGLIILGFLAIAAYLLNSWLHRPMPVQPQAVPPAKPNPDIELARVGLPQGYPHTGK